MKLNYTPRSRFWLALFTLAIACNKSRAETTAASEAPAAPKAVTLLNVSYDPTRELYQDAGYSSWVGSPPLAHPHGALEAQKM